MAAEIIRVLYGTLTTKAGVYPVTKFILDAIHNDIPTVEVHIDPTHSGPATEGGIAPATPVVDASEVSRTYRAIKVLETSDEDRVSSLDIRLSDRDLKLDNWLIIGVGQLLETTGSISLVITLAHPAYVLKENTVCILGSSNYFTADADKTLDKATHLLDGVIRALEARINNLTGEGFDSFDVLVKKARNLVDALRTTIAWEGPPWPVEAVAGNLVSLRRNLYDEIRQMGSLTAWDFIMSVLVNQYGVSIIPTYWEPTLTMTPFTPWSGTPVDLTDNAITRIVFPGTDAMRLCGVCILTATKETVDDTENIQFDADRAAKVSIGGNVYIEPTLPGTVINMGLPPWISNCVKKVDSGSGGGGTDTFGIGIGNTGNSVVGSDETHLELVDEASSLMAKYYFSVMYRRNATASVQCKLLLDSMLAPGMQCKITGSYGTLFKFMCVKVTHVVDVLGGKAYTTVAGSYARADGEPVGLKAIKDGTTLNYMYSKAK